MLLSLSLAPTLAWFGTDGGHRAFSDLVGQGDHSLTYQYSRFIEDIPEEIRSPYLSRDAVSLKLACLWILNIGETRQSLYVDHSPFVVFHTYGMTHLL